MSAKKALSKLPVTEGADPKVLDEVYKSLIVMQRKPEKKDEATYYGNTVFHEDYILKKAHSEWRKYWAILKGDRLLFYSSKEETGAKEKGLLEVCFVSAEVITTEDSLARKQAKTDVTSICKYRLSVYTPNDYHLLSGETDGQVEAWLKAVQNLLSQKFSSEELANKTKASEHLMPLMVDQRRVEKDQYEGLMKTLQSSGLFWGKKTAKPLKEGYLKLKEQDLGGSWVKYYFRLYRDNLSYFRLDNKATPFGVIALNFILDALPRGGKGKGAEGAGRSFRIITPLRSYSLKAKHDISMKDWINAVNTVKAGKLLSEEGGGESEKNGGESLPLLTASLSEVELPENDEVYNGEFKLNWKDDEGEHTFKFKGRKKVTVGRSSNSDVQVVDSRLSRNHCAIEVRGKIPIFLDLGSSHGSKIHGVKVSKQVLKPGDVITLGDTQLTFKVVPNGKK